MSHGPARESEGEVEEKITPPDGGWGWVVVFASFMIHIITDGITYTFGIFYATFLKVFHTSDTATSWIVSILVGVTLCSGPLSSALVNKFGCRAVTIVGAILASSCMALSVFAESVEALYLTVGLGVGLGFGLIYLPAIVSVTCYFEKYRSLATGIAVCGSGLGTFVFAPVNSYLQQKYNWTGAFLILSGLLLVCIVFGLIFKPIEPVVKEVLLVHQNDSQNAKKDSSLKIDLTSVNEIKNNSNSSNHLNNTPNKVSEKVTEKEPNGDIQKRPHSVHLFDNVNPLQQMNGTATPVTNNKRSSIKSPNSRLAVSQPHLLSTTDRRQWGSQVLRPTHSGIMYNKNIFYRGSLKQLEQTNRTYSWINIKRPQEEKALMEKPSKVKLQLEDDDTSRCCGMPKETVDTLKEMLDFSLFRDPVFILFTVSNFATSIGFYIPYVYIVVQAKSKEIPEYNANMLLAILGIANTVGRIVLGYLSDKPWVNRLWVYNVCLTVCGIATVLSAFCQTFKQFAIYISIFGFTTGAYVGLTSVILVDLLSLDRLTNAFGLLLLFQGIASFLGPPIGGLLRDYYLTYDPAFYVAGVTIAISGVMLFVIPALQRWLERTKRRDQNNYQLEFCRSS